MEISVQELDKLLQKEFERGKNCFQSSIVHTPFVQTKDITNIGEIRTYTTTASSCVDCPKNPENGGDGICHCTLGMMKITC